MKNDTVSLHKGKEKVDQQVAIVTGSSSSGIGYETSLSLARNGFYVFATVRRLGESINPITDTAMNEKLPLQFIQPDVNNDKSVIEAINRIAKEKGRIDVVIDNAGYALYGAFKETSIHEIKAQFETNYQ
jgi:NADP-dependent 3-hydroxy acid dehydrogenase YdfG